MKIIAILILGNFLAFNISLASESIDPQTQYLSYRDSPFQLGMNAGHDYGSGKDIYALSGSVPINESNWKISAEYSIGRNHDGGSNLGTLKVIKDFWLINSIYLGGIVGIGHTTDQQKYGNGGVYGLEILCDVNRSYNLKIEATRFNGWDLVSSERSNIIQGGIIYKF